MAAIETTHFNQAIRSFLDPPINTIVRPVQEGSKTFLFIEIPAAKGTLILAGKKNEAAGLYPGRIYTRTTNVSSAEVQSSEEFREILSRFCKHFIKNKEQT